MKHDFETILVLWMTAGIVQFIWRLDFWSERKMSTIIDVNFQFQSNNGLHVNHMSVCRQESRLPALATQHSPKKQRVFDINLNMSKIHTTGKKCSAVYFNYFKPADASSKLPFYYYLTWRLSSSSAAAVADALFLFLTTCFSIYICSKTLLPSHFPGAAHLVTVTFPFALIGIFGPNILCHTSTPDARKHWQLKRPNKGKWPSFFSHSLSAFPAGKSCVPKERKTRRSKWTERCDKTLPLHY